MRWGIVTDSSSDLVKSDFNFEDIELEIVPLSVMAGDRVFVDCEDPDIDEFLEYTKKLMRILKDADALDRVRLDYNTGILITDLNPKYLRTNTAKRLLNASYQLEGLTNKVSFDKILAYKTEEQTEGESRPKAYRRLLEFTPTPNKLNTLEENNRTMSKEKKKYDWEQEQ